MHKNLSIAAVIALAGAAGACSSDEPSAKEQHYAQPAASYGDEATPPPPDPTKPAPAPSATAEEQPAAIPENGMSRPGDEPIAESLRDGQILKITDLVNSAEVEQAQLARTKASDPQVKQFAAMMIKDHMKAKQEGLQLGKQASLEQEDSTKAHELQNKTEETLATLKAVEPTTFDNAYMNAQVEQHQAVLDLLNNTLISAATNPKLKAELEATRTAVQRHLGHAQQIHQTLAAAR